MSLYERTLLDHNSRMIARKPVVGERVHYEYASRILPDTVYSGDGVVLYVYTNGFALVEFDQLGTERVMGTERVCGWDTLTLLEGA